MADYLLNDMRVDESALRSLKTNDLSKISKTYKDSRVNLLIEFIKKWKR